MVDSAIANDCGVSGGGYEETERKGESRGLIVTVSPFRCRVWSFHDRLQDYVSEDSCKAELDSFARHGQLIPALGRPLQGNRSFDVEIVCGARRLFVAQHLNVPLRVELRKMSDREAIVAMDMENRHRRDVSPYERGVSYADWIRAKIFSSQDELARALDISPAQVSRLLRLAQLPGVVVNAFPSPMDIKEGWGLKLHAAWHDHKLRTVIAHRARAIASEKSRPSPAEVFDRLLSQNRPRTAKRRSGCDDVVYGPERKPLFRIHRRRTYLALLIPNGSISDTILERIRFAVSEVLLASAPPSSAQNHKGVTFHDEIAYPAENQSV